MPVQQELPAGRHRNTDVGVQELSLQEQNVINYICGYIVKKIVSVRYELIVMRYVILGMTLYQRKTTVRQERSLIQFNVTCMMSLYI